MIAAILPLLLAAAPAVEPSPPDAAAAEDAVRARIAQVRARMNERIREPGVVADLYELHRLADETGHLERVTDALMRVAWNGRAHAEARALAQFLVADVERRRGRLPRAQPYLDVVGAITEVAVIGPFDNENKGGFEVAYGPEKELDLATSHEGLRAEVRWRVVPDLAESGVVRLYEALRPSRDVVAYALAVLDVPQDRAAVLQLGASGATKAWLNGRLVLLDPAYHPARFGQAAAPVQLKRGENFLLVKIATAGDDLPAVQLRLSEPDGDRIPGLSVRAPTQGSYPAPQPSARPPPLQRPLLAELRRAAEAPGASPRAALDLAVFLEARRPFDEAERLHVRWAERAAAAAPGDVDAQLIAALAEVDDAKVRRGNVAAAVRAERPGEARAHAELARYHLDHGRPRRALELLAPRLSQAKGDFQAALVHVRALDALGLDGQARRAAAELARRFPDEPAVLHEAATYARRDDDGEAAHRALRVALALHPADDSIASALASLLLDRGAVDDALLVLEQVARFHPVDTALLARRADLLAANGRLDQAKALYRRLLEICPQEGDFWERLGRALLRAGDPAAALEALEASLAARPQDARVRELVRSLKPGAASFARPYLKDLREVAAAAAGKYAGEDAVQLVELTAVRVLPSGQASRTVQVIRKALTHRGVEDSRFQIRYAPDREELKIERARVLKADGTVVDGHAEDDDSLHEPWAGLYYDARARVIGFPGLAEGDTVELVYRVDDVARDNLLSDYFGDLSYLEDVVPKASWEYVLEAPAGRKIFANRVAGLVHTETASASGGTVHRWTAKDVPRVVPEPDMPGWPEVTRYLHVSTYADWEGVSRFWWGLVRDQVAPTPAVEKLAQEIVAGIPEADVAARVRAVYGWVVRRTRYVGLEFGIHSFKPYKVERILSRAFGDCKDKASLTHALLRTLGIESRLVLLRMRDLGRVGEAPASLAVFNHAILYVPSLELWLDGTAEWSGSSELPEVDHGAEVLVVNPDGASEFRITPEATAEQSVNASTYRVALDASGAARIAGESTITGLGAAGYRRAYASPNGRKAAFEQAWARSFPGLTVERLEVSDVTKLEEPVKLGYELALPRYAEPTAAGGLAFTPFGIGASYVETYAALSSRKFDVVLAYPWTTTFRYEHALPDGLVPAALPPKVEDVTPFGVLELAATHEGSTLVVEGRIALTAPRVSPKDYGAFRAFLARVDAAMARRVVLVKEAAASR